MHIATDRKAENGDELLQRCEGTAFSIHNSYKGESIVIIEY
jgi:hypothetical protein